MAESASSMDSAQVTALLQADMAGVSLCGWFIGLLPLLLERILDMELPRLTLCRYFVLWMGCRRYLRCSSN